MAKNKSAVSASSAAAALASGEASTGTSVVVPANRAIQLPGGFKIKRMITVPSLVLKEGLARAIRIDSEIRVSKVVDTKTKREPANICDVTDVETGEKFIFLCPKVVQANLERDYPDLKYVGKAFYIQNLGKRTETQRYNDFGIAEIEAEEATEA